MVPNPLFSVKKLPDPVVESAERVVFKAKGNPCSLLRVVAMARKQKKNVFDLTQFQRAIRSMKLCMPPSVSHSCR